MRRLHPLVSEQAENLVPEDIASNRPELAPLGLLEDTEIENISPQTREIIDLNGILSTVWINPVLESPIPLLNPEIIEQEEDEEEEHVDDHFDAMPQEDVSTPIPLVRRVERSPIVEDSVASELNAEQVIFLENAVEEAHREIPLNSPTILISETTSRFSSALWYEKIQEKKIILAGLGGIGRFGNLNFFTYLYV